MGEAKGEVDTAPLLAQGSKSMLLFNKLLGMFGLTAAVLVLGTGPAQGALPPDELQKRNLNAAEILIGMVAEVAPAPSSWRQLLPPLPAGEGAFFTLNITHVVKSSQAARQGEYVKVLFIREKPISSEIGVARAGWSAVQVSPGDMVIVYANPVTQDGQNLLLPILAGSSVIRLAPSSASQDTPTVPKANR